MNIFSTWILCEAAKSSEFAVLSLCGAANLQLCVYLVPAISGPVRDERFHYTGPSVSLCEACILSFEGVYNTSAGSGITCENE